MAPLPPESTGRIWIDYQANGFGHTVMFRYPGTGDPAPAVITGINGILTAMQPFMPTNWTLLGIRYAVAGSTVSNALNAAIITPTGAGTPKQGEAPAYLTILGRSAQGRRARIFFIGTSVSAADEGGVNGDYRTSATESSSVLALLTAAQNSGLVAVDGLQPVWKPYVNVGYNAYWQKRVRP